MLHLLLHHLLPHQSNILRTILDARANLGLTLLSQLLHLEHLLLGPSLSLLRLEHANIGHILHDEILGTPVELLPLRRRDQVMISVILFHGHVFKELGQDHAKALAEELLDLLVIGGLGGSLSRHADLNWGLHALLYEVRIYLSPSWMRCLILMWRAGRGSLRMEMLMRQHFLGQLVNLGVVIGGRLLKRFLRGGSLLLELLWVLTILLLLHMMLHRSLLVKSISLGTELGNLLRGQCMTIAKLLIEVRRMLLIHPM